MNTIRCTTGFPNVICATPQDGKICGGDSGGALVGNMETSWSIFPYLCYAFHSSKADRDNNGVWVLYGITSYGYGDCNYQGAYSGFVDVAAWSRTLLDIVARNSKSAASKENIIMT